MWELGIGGKWGKGERGGKREALTERIGSQGKSELLHCGGGGNQMVKLTGHSRVRQVGMGRLACPGGFSVGCKIVIIINMNS
jgi:hypothetical protein